MVNLNGHEAGNGGYSQRTPTARRDSSTRSEIHLANQTDFHVISGARTEVGEAA